MRFHFEVIGGDVRAFLCVGSLVSEQVVFFLRSAGWVGSPEGKRAHLRSCAWG
jgi:hypothetical protein